MLEIEMKFPVPDFQAVVAQLEAWKARRGKTEQEEDLYFRPPDRDFAQTDEAVRLRRTGPLNIATYKGPKEAGPTKTRTEIEVPLAEGPEAAEAFKRFMEGLRYQTVAIVRKKRISYHFDREGLAMQTCLDEVEQVGSFVELEIVTEPEHKQRAQEVLQRTAVELNLGKSDRRSYLEMVLKNTP